MPGLYGQNPNRINEIWFSGVEIPRTASTFETYAERFPDIESRLSSSNLILDLAAGDAVFADHVNSNALYTSKVIRCDIGYKEGPPNDRQLAVAGSALEIPFIARSFDVVLSSLFIMHLKPAQQVKVATEIGRILKPGGRALLYRHKTCSDPEYLHKIPTLDPSTITIKGLLATVISRH